MAISVAFVLYQFAVYTADDAANWRGSGGGRVVEAFLGVLWSVSRFGALLTQETVAFKLSALPRFPTTSGAKPPDRTGMVGTSLGGADKAKRASGGEPASLPPSVPIPTNESPLDVKAEQSAGTPNDKMVDLEYVRNVMVSRTCRVRIS
eukprot:867984-Prorocentrum_minimum.AAC.2